jgi:hypothetical protein
MRQLKLALNLQVRGAVQSIMNYPHGSGELVIVFPVHLAPTPSQKR